MVVGCTKSRDSELTAEQKSAVLHSGIPLQEVLRQMALLTRSEPFRIHADRACTVDDGVWRLSGDERQHFIKKGRAVVMQGGLTDFIPASGAATRMFADLLEAKQCGDDFLRGVPDMAASDKRAEVVHAIFSKLSSFAFYQELRDEVWQRSGGELDLDRVGADDLLRHGHGPLVISSLIDGDGLALTHTPKALIHFHRYEQGEIRTALAEHLHTSLQVGADHRGICRVHFTCSPEHMEGFKIEAQRVADDLQRAHGVTFNLSFSIQEPHSDTVCVTEKGHLFLEQDGTLHLRPGGHGALLFNLNTLGERGAECVYINNIDNVHPDRFKAEFVQSKLMMLGLLSDVQEIAHRVVKVLSTLEVSDECVDELYQEVSRSVGLGISEGLWNSSDSQIKRELLRHALDRPVRVVGVVKNTGEPGGGPFWVRGKDGQVTRQIVEKHELDLNDRGQLKLFNTSTHFNPVRIVCGLKNYEGNPYDLQKFTNPEAVLISTKSVHGTAVKILERPGLWNGSMAEWITVFVEVDGATFAPVKGVLDLAREAHRC